MQACQVRCVTWVMVCHDACVQRTHEVCNAGVTRPPTLNMKFSQCCPGRQMMRLPLILLALLLRFPLSTWGASDAHGGPAVHGRKSILLSTPPPAVSTCALWAAHPLSSAIDRDMSHWEASGITPEGMSTTLMDYASPRSRLPVAGVGIMVTGSSVCMHACMHACGRALYLNTPGASPCIP